jgi:hypothetical protein
LIGGTALVNGLTVTPTPISSPTKASTLTPLPTYTALPSPTITPTPTPPSTPAALLEISLPVVESAARGISCFGSKGYGVSCIDSTGWQTYTSSNSGLQDDTILSLSVCKDGSILAANKGGLQVFDGSSWSQAVPGDVDVPLKVICDPGGGYWAAHSRSISRYKDNKWTNSPLARNATRSDGLDFLQDMALAPDGKLWVITNNQLSRFDGRAWQIFEPEQKPSGNYVFTKIAIDANGDPWVASPGGLFTYKGQTWENFYQPALPAPGSMTIDSRQNIWIGTLGGIFKFNGGGWDSIEARPKGLGSSAVVEAKFDENGRLWAATAYGMAVFDGKNWITYRMDNSPLPDNLVTSLAVTSGGPALPAVVSKVAGRLSGRVLSEGAPVNDKRIELCVEPLGTAYSGETPCENQAFHQLVKTDGLGDFTFRDVPPGRYQLAIEINKDNWTTYARETGEGNTAFVPPGVYASLGTINVEPKPGPTSLTMTPTPTETPEE